MRKGSTYSDFNIYKATVRDSSEISADASKPVTKEDMQKAQIRSKFKLKLTPEELKKGLRPAWLSHILRPEKIKDQNVQKISMTRGRLDQLIQQSDNVIDNSLSYVTSYDLQTISPLTMKKCGMRKTEYDTNQAL